MNKVSCPKSRITKLWKYAQYKREHLGSFQDLAIENCPAVNMNEMPSNGWMDGKNGACFIVICYHKGYYVIIKKDTLEKFLGKWIHLENVILNEMNGTYINYCTVPLMWETQRESKHQDGS